MKKYTIFAALVAAIVFMFTLAGCQQQQVFSPGQRAEGLMNEFLMELGLPDGVQLDTISGDVDAFRQNAFDVSIQDGQALVRWLVDEGNRVEFAKADVESLTLLPYWNVNGKMTALSGEVIYAKGLRNPKDNTTVTVVAYSGALYYVSPAELQPNKAAAKMMATLTENRGDAVDLKAEYLVRKGVKPEETGLGLLLSEKTQDATMWQQGQQNMLDLFLQRNTVNPKWLMKELSYKDIPNITLSLDWFYGSDNRSKPGNDEKFYTVFFDDDGITKLEEKDKLLFAVSVDGKWLVSFKLSDALKGAIGNGGYVPPTTTPIPGPVGQDPSPSPSPTNPPAQKVLSKLELTPNTWKVAQGGTVTFTLTAVYTDGTRENVSGATWSVNQGYGLSVANGTLTASKTATIGKNYTVYATWGGKQSNNAIGEVTKGQADKTLVSIAVNPTTWTVVQGGNTSLTAKATYSDGSTEDITAKGTWSINQGYGLSVSGGKITATATATVGTNYTVIVKWNGKEARSIGAVTAAAPKSATIRILVRDAETFATIDDFERQIEIGKTTTYTISASGAYKIVSGTMGAANGSLNGDYSITSPKVAKADVFYVYLVSKSSPSQNGVLELVPSPLEPGTYNPYPGYENPNDPEEVNPIEYDGDPEAGQGADWTDTAPVEGRPENGTPQTGDDFNEGSWSNPK